MVVETTIAEQKRVVELADTSEQLHPSDPLPTDPVCNVLLGILPRWTLFMISSTDLWSNSINFTLVYEVAGKANLIALCNITHIFCDPFDGVDVCDFQWI